MTGNNREIKSEDISLMEFIRMLAGGKFLIPAFQRHFVWEPTAIINLWDSIYHFYPIGSILYWKTNTRLNIYRRLGGHLIPSDSSRKTEKQERAYILDGQQRTTALFVSFYGGKGRISNRQDFNYAVYFDALNSSFFFDNELYKRRWEVNPAFLLRLDDMANMEADAIRRLTAVPGYKPQVKDNVKQLRHALHNYTIPLICIKGYDIAGVCSIFERINQAGRKLENSDIMIARSFQNNPLIVEED